MTTFLSLRHTTAVRSLIQPCTSHSMIAPTSSSTEIAHRSSTRSTARRVFVASMLNSLRGRIRGRGCLFLDQGSEGLGFNDAGHILEASLCVGVCDMPFRPQDLADRMAKQVRSDGFVRETFSLPREQARAKPRAFLKSYPAAAYMSQVERAVA